MKIPLSLFTPVDTLVFKYGAEKSDEHVTSHKELLEALALLPGKVVVHLDAPDGVVVFDAPGTHDFSRVTFRVLDAQEIELRLGPTTQISSLGSVQGNHTFSQRAKADVQRKALRHKRGQQKRRERMRREKS
jgi:hypothetical protein